MRARVTWNVDVTTTTRRHAWTRASRAIIRASPWVLNGRGSKQRTGNRVGPSSPRQSRRAFFHLRP